MAHANTLRGLVKTIDDIGEDEIQNVSIPTGIPIVYKFEKLANGELQSVPPKSQENSVSQLHMTGQFLEKPGLLKVRLVFGLYYFLSDELLCQLVLNLLIFFVFIGSVEVGKGMDEP